MLNWLWGNREAANHLDSPLIGPDSTRRPTTLHESIHQSTNTTTTHTLHPSSSINGHHDDESHRIAFKCSESLLHTLDDPVRFPALFIWPPWYVTLSFLVWGVFMALQATVFKEKFDSWGVSTIDLLKYSSIPIVSVFFTYGHIWQALWMTFYPIQYAGCAQIPGTNTGLGWQGIVPFKAEKMARMAVQLMTKNLIDTREIFARLEPERVVAELTPLLDRVLTECILAVAEQYSPDLWHLLPQRIRSEILKQAKEDAPGTIGKMMENMETHIDEIFDIESMVVATLTRDQALLNNIFIRCGYKELAFIRNSGGWMGFIFGVIQTIIWYFYQAQWLLPVFGLVVGFLTNWLALKMIFKPINPHYVCGFRIQGLFLARQQEVSAEYGATIAGKVLTAKNILTAIIAGPTTDRLFEIVRMNVAESIDRFARTDQAFASMLIKWTVGTEKLEQIKLAMSESITRQLPLCLEHLEAYTEEALDLERTLTQKMGDLDPETFESLLHPVFEEDEWKLVVMGGVLGVIIGAVQMFILV